MKIYTKTGDAGKTGLIGGARVAKDDLRLNCCGTLDELNAALGMTSAQAGAAADDQLIHRLARVQGELFVIGAALAAPPGKGTGLPALAESSITALETEIDAAESQLRPLHNFILPGGSETAARLHQSRAICRRAERVIVQFASQQPVEALILKYLNRLGDWLFVQARLANHRAGVPDVPWTGGK